MLPALRCVGNLIGGSDTQTQAAIDAGALGSLTPLLNHAKRNVRKEAVWAVSNVAAGTPTQIATLLATPHLMQAVVAQLRTGEWHVRREAAWVVANVATTGNLAQVSALMALDVSGPLVDTLSSGDTRMILVLLDALGSLLDKGVRGGVRFADALEEAGLPGVLEGLQDHDSTDVYSKAVHLLETYYDAEVEGDTAGVFDAGAAAEAVVALGGENSLVGGKVVAPMVEAGGGGFSFEFV